MFTLMRNKQGRSKPTLGYRVRPSPLRWHASVGNMRWREEVCRAEVDIQMKTLNFWFLVQLLLVMVFIWELTWFT